MSYHGTEISSSASRDFAFLRRAQDRVYTWVLAAFLNKSKKQAMERVSRSRFPSPENTRQTDYRRRRELVNEVKDAREGETEEGGKGGGPTNVHSISKSSEEKRRCRCRCRVYRKSKGSLLPLNGGRVWSRGKTVSFMERAVFSTYQNGAEKAVVDFNFLFYEVGRIGQRSHKRLSSLVG
jgi:hypothetical protein